MGWFRSCLVSGVWVSLLFVALFGVVLNVPLVWGSGTIYIRADGSIDPPTASISTLDNITYTFTASIYDTIFVNRSNIIIDGNGYVLQGNGSSWSYGFIVSHLVSNVTIKETKIERWASGIWSYSFTNISRNHITNNTIGIYLQSSSQNKHEDYS